MEPASNKLLVLFLLLFEEFWPLGQGRILESFFKKHLLCCIYKLLTKIILFSKSKPQVNSKKIGFKFREIQPPYSY